MNSLESLKQELIKQKNLLDEKGYFVAIANTNPSPSEITSAIEKINFDFTVTTATEEDVLAGKTFFSQTNELKTGTLDFSIIEVYKSYLAAIISGEGCIPIYIPDSVSTIRKYGYYTNPDNKNKLVYNADNLTIPNNIITLEPYAFAYSNLTGTVTISENCTSIGNYTFRNTNISEAIINGGLTESSSYIFESCASLTKVVISHPLTKLPTNMFTNCRELTEVTLPESLLAIAGGAFFNCPSLKLIKFLSPTPPTLEVTSFANTYKAKVLVPYKSYGSYFNATNYKSHNNPIIGYGEFSAGSTPPTVLGLFNFVWYSNLDDLDNATNPVTITSEAGTYYTVGTKITT